MDFDAAGSLRMAGIARTENLGPLRWLVRDGAWAAFDPAADLNFNAAPLTFAAWIAGYAAADTTPATATGAAWQRTWTLRLTGARRFARVNFVP